MGSAKCRTRTIRETAGRVSFAVSWATNGRNESRNGEQIAMQTLARRNTRRDGQLRSMLMNFVEAAAIERGALERAKRHRRLPRSCQQLTSEPLLPASAAKRAWTAHPSGRRGAGGRGTWGSGRRAAE